jgi:hypothetical protein
MIQGVGMRMFDMVAKAAVGIAVLALAIILLSLVIKVVIFALPFVVIGGIGYVVVKSVRKRIS